MADFNVPPVNRWCEVKADAEDYLRAEFEKVNMQSVQNFGCLAFLTSSALEQRIVLIDGAMGTVIQQYKLKVSCFRSRCCLFSRTVPQFFCCRADLE